MAYRRTLNTNTGIMRIFNTYGPRMRPDDGRVVTSFIVQALNGDPLTVYGDGTQTRSLCYVDDLVRGILAMLDSNVVGPINLGNPVELTVNELAACVLGLTGSHSGLEHHALPCDDPLRRRPAIALAEESLAWRPQVSLEHGLRRTVAWFRSRPADVAAARAAVAGGQLDGVPLQRAAPAASPSAVPMPEPVRTWGPTCG
jgi:dTDP-glucose 4,6-dehydratase